MLICCSSRRPACPLQLPRDGSPSASSFSFPLAVPVIPDSFLSLSLFSCGSPEPFGELAFDKTQRAFPALPLLVPHLFPYIRVVFTQCLGWGIAPMSKVLRQSDVFPAAQEFWPLTPRVSSRLAEERMADSVVFCSFMCLLTAYRASSLEGPF